MYTLILIGIISGILTGITGIQYGILVPGLLITNTIPNIKTAIGTVLYTFLPPTAIFSVYHLYKKGHVDVGKGNILIIVLLFSIWIGSKISSYLSKKTIAFITSLVMMCMSLFFFYEYKKIETHQMIL